MILIKFLLIILIHGVFVQKKFHVKESNSILLSTLSIFLSLYLFGLFDLLKYGLYFVYFILLLEVIWLGYQFYKKRLSLNLIWNPTYITFVIGTIFLFVLTYNANLTDWDEFSHWGTNLKAMVFKDILWGSNKWDGVHIAYPPLSGVIEYFGCKLYGGYSEWIAFFSLDIFMLSLLTPVFKTKWKDFLKNILYLLCIYMVVYIFDFKLASLYIDLPLGILFFIGFYLSTLEKSKENKLLLSLIFFALPIFKDSGLIFSAVILIQLFIRQLLECINKKEFSIKLLIPYIIYLLIIFSSYFTYKIYCNINNTVVDFMHDSNAIMELNLIEYVKAIFLRGVTGKPYDIACSFYNFINTNSIISRYPFQTIIGIIVSFNIIGFILYYIDKKEKNNLISIFASFNIGSILYLLFLLLIFIYAFLEPEGRALASFPRYISTYLIAWAIMILTLLLKHKKSIVPILIGLLVCIYSSNIITLVKPVSKGISVIPENVNNWSKEIIEKVDEDSKVFIIIQQDNGYQFHTLRYLISPIKTNLLYEWNLGPTNETSELATLNMTKEEWLNKLKSEKFDYVYLANVDDQFIELYGSLFGKEKTKEDLENKIYKIGVNNEEITFDEIH